jgi:hypothetical protein
MRLWRREAFTMSGGGNGGAGRAGWAAWIWNTRTTGRQTAEEGEASRAGARATVTAMEMDMAWEGWIMDGT